MGKREAYAGTCADAKGEPNQYHSGFDYINPRRSPHITIEHAHQPYHQALRSSNKAVKSKSPEAKQDTSVRSYIHNLGSDVEHIIGTMVHLRRHASRADEDDDKWSSLTIAEKIAAFQKVKLRIDKDGMKNSTSSDSDTDKKRKETIKDDEEKEEKSRKLKEKMKKKQQRKEKERKQRYKEMEEKEHKHRKEMEEKERNHRHKVEMQEKERKQKHKEEMELKQKASILAKSNSTAKTDPEVTALGPNAIKPSLKPSSTTQAMATTKPTNAAKSQDPRAPVDLSKQNVIRPVTGAVVGGPAPSQVRPEDPNAKPVPNVPAQITKVAARAAEVLKVWVGTS